MAKVDPFIPKIFPWETGKTIDKATEVKMAFDKADPGGYTKFGITLATWITRGYDKDGDGDIDKDDLALLNVEDYEKMVKINFWDQWRADYINSQSIAEMLVDWVWASGSYGIREPQKMLGLKADGVVGMVTINAINNYPNQEELHKMIYRARFDFIDRITLYSIQSFERKIGRTPTSDELNEYTFQRFQQGWKNRIIDLFKDFKATE
jgi:lysozyme family protein